MRSWMIVGAGLSVACAGAPGAQPGPVAPEPPRADPLAEESSTSTSTPTSTSTSTPTSTSDGAPGSLEVAGQGVRATESEERKLSTDEPACAPDMARAERLQGGYCVDRHEASLVRAAPDNKEVFWPGNLIIDGKERQFRAVSVAGRKPQGYISGKQAARVCAASGKRLCEVDEWVRACRGPALTRYPYGNKRAKNKCNDRYKVLNHHPVIRLFKKYAPDGTDPIKMWHPSWMNDKRLHGYDHTVTRTGERAECVNDFGVHDMVGNLHEWVADPDGTFFGGYFMDTFQNGEGCEYRTIGHPHNYHDYSTGFRCCADLGVDTLGPPAN